ncbi:MAG: GNAT family N-acetyltransferase [Candidatus Latescibacter sp.]|nr:GNAT family N-acetyltransferase [Candidatus Latescibacter sp.]
MTIRAYAEADHGILNEITAVCYNGVSIDQNIEKLFGRIAGKDWTCRKQRQLDEDISAHPDGIFVAEIDHRVVGYISTRIDHATKIGRILNFAVLPAQQKRGIGKALMDRAIAHLKSEGMEYVRIETLDQNAAGKHFYPKLGFSEVARQIHYIRRTDST